MSLNWEPHLPAWSAWTPSIACLSLVSASAARDYLGTKGLAGCLAVCRWVKWSSHISRAQGRLPRRWHWLFILVYPGWLRRRDRNLSCVVSSQLICDPWSEVQQRCQSLAQAVSERLFRMTLLRISVRLRSCLPKSVHHLCRSANSRNLFRSFWRSTLRAHSQCRNFCPKQ